MKKTKCLALFSGGLDSMLSIRLMKMQGIDVLALHMNTGFGSKTENFDKIKSYANTAGAEFEVVDIKNPFLQNVLFNPTYGYGKYLNPCIDCHGFMFKTALDMLEEKDAQFIITGEVLGQRPMSQRATAMDSVKKLSGSLNELVLRPLSAKLLKPTVMEIEGVVDRELLLDISGRGRDRQLALAKEFGFSEFETPAGGCLLTLEYFYKKMKDMIEHEKIETNEDVDILKFGRHFRLPDGAKLVIGRNKEENETLKKIDNKKFIPIFLKDVVGGHCLISKGTSKEDLMLAFKLLLVYAKTESNEHYEVVFMDKNYISKPFISKEAASRYILD